MEGLSTGVTVPLSEGNGALDFLRSPGDVSLSIC